MAAHSLNSVMPSSSPSSSSSIRSYRPCHQHSVDTRYTASSSPAIFDYSQHAASHHCTHHRYETMEPSNTVTRQPCRYSRRQVSIEAAHCIFVDESSCNGTVYTFLVKPTLLQTGRSGGRNRTNKRADGSRLSEQMTRCEDEDEESVEQQRELEPYHVEKTSKELLELSNRLVASFDILLDPRRGGPVPLSKDLLHPKWNVKDIFRRRKKSGVAQETQAAEATSVAKKDVINDFFLRVLRTGGEVLSSSRAMQDFL